MQGLMQGLAVTAEGGIIKVSPFRAGGETSHGNSNYELFFAVQLAQYHSTNNGENGD
jgi:hypothetical protein